jgi:hypothetical protein
VTKPLGLLGLSWLVTGLAAGLIVAPAPPIASAEPIPVWHDLFDGGIGQEDSGRAALTDADGNLVIAGETSDASPGLDLLVRKLDRLTGTEIWSRVVPSTDGNDLQVGGMVWDGSGNLLVGGTRLGCFG